MLSVTSGECDGKNNDYLKNIYFLKKYFKYSNYYFIFIVLINNIYIFFSDNLG